jgi:uncharacterized membrane protein YgaE (UPF0421/DUF939 family)
MMNHHSQTTGVSRLEFGEYIVKCLVGVSIGYLLLRAFPREYGDSLWVLISILLSITVDNNSKVAIDRMKANILGSTIGLLVFLLRNPSNLLTICIGVTLTIIVCYRLKLMDVSRTALVAFIIVVLYNAAHRTWNGALERMGSVVAGCLIGLVINHVFRHLVGAVYGAIPASAPQTAGNPGKGDGGE